MLFYIIYNDLLDNNLFTLWINHYKKLNFNYGIYVDNNNLEEFKKKYINLISYIINYIPENILQLTEYDFLFSYDKDDNDNMILTYMIEPSFINDSLCIGRVFYVPIKDRNPYTTFEIPDFILYQHTDHTNYTINGIKINGGKNISDNIVSLNLNISKVDCIIEYYENNIFYGGNISFNQYLQYSINLIVNKEKKYGIIWHPKCACTTINHIFCLVNNISINKNHKKSLNFFRPKYRYNNYLQNINIVSFIRNPYHRFLSTFIDKHIYRTDNTFLNLIGYKNYLEIVKKDSINNLCIFLLNNNYISDHYCLLTNFGYNKLYKNIVYNTIRIEDDLNKKLYNFLKKYHNDIDNYNIIDLHDNSIFNYNKDYSKNNLSIVDPKLKYFDKNEWDIYLNKNILNYKIILDKELKKLIYKYFENDFIKFKY